MTKRIILKTSIKREKNKLYYCGTDEEGNICVGEADMKRGGKKKEEPQKPKLNLRGIFGRKK